MEYNQGIRDFSDIFKLEYEEETPDGTIVNVIEKNTEKWI